MNASLLVVRARWARAGLCLAVLLALAGRGAAQSASEQAKSLALVPENAAMYGVLLHNKDVFDAVIASKAFAELQTIPQVAMGWQMAQGQYNEAKANPLFAGVIKTLVEGASDEVFVYADPSYAELMRVYQMANAQGTVAQYMGLAQGFAGGDGPDPTAQFRGMLDVFNDNIDKLKMFDMVIGLRVKDAEAAQGLVGLVKIMATQQLAAQPDLAKRLTEETVG
ncbi:MAG: hypothetical protein KDA41_09540, partial [Planctomycetales bacterium]|nr:hypothetical protein [Planctomycetales bacterium]